jgi:hypothetical protein
MQIQNTKYQHVSSFLIHINTQIKKSLNEKSQSHLEITLYFLQLTLTFISFSLHAENPQVSSFLDS